MMTSGRGEIFELDEAIRVLTATPGSVGALLGDLQDSWLEFQEEQEAWNPRTILVHYIHNELTNWMPRVRVTLSDAEVRQFPPFQQLPDLADYEAYDLQQLLARFADLRQQNLVEMQNLKLGAADFSRQAEHPVLGTVNLRQLLASWVVHDLNHLHQIAKSLAKRYREEVGPWRPNLPIVDL
ncbi:MAG: DinB family protein [Chloroflexota bacterium]|nr:MAG: DinB family protein [Chloroflexota bacterium]